MNTSIIIPSSQAITQSLYRLSEKRRQLKVKDYLSISGAIGLNSHELIAQRGEVWGLVGGVGSGKTALSLQLAVYLAKNKGLQTLFVSPETPDYIIHRRAMQMLTKQAKEDILNNIERIGTQSLAILNKIRVLAKAVNKQSLPNAIKLLEQREDRKFDLIVIDHLKLLDWQTDDIRIELEQFCPFIKQLAERLNCIVLLVNQVPKYIEQQISMHNSKIAMIDVAEASGIYQVLDGGLIIDCPRGSNSSDRLVSVGKARDFSTTDLSPTRFRQSPIYWLFEPEKVAEERESRSALVDREEIRAAKNVSFF